MTCKDCLHADACEGYMPTDLDSDVWHYCREGRADQIPDIEERCSSFKDSTNYVEVVRCKDCKYWREDILRDDDEMKCCSIGFYMTQGNNFCSFGKKIGGDGDV